MSQEIKYTCNVCGKRIEPGYDEANKATITIKYYDKGDAKGRTYHAHDTCDRHGASCLSKITKLLNK